jgi:hypothetical protein
MITQKTAERIWVAYREIAAGEQLLADTKETREREDLDEFAPTLKDAFGNRQHFQLGVPSGTNGHRLFYVSPQLAEPVIRAHIAAKRSELAEANEQARIEIDLSEIASPSAR